MLRLNFHQLESIGCDDAIHTVVHASDEQIGQLLLDNVVTGDFSKLVWVGVLTTAAYRLLGIHQGGPLDGMAAENLHQLQAQSAEGWGNWDSL